MATFRERLIAFAILLFVWVGVPTVMVSATPCLAQESATAVRAEDGSQVKADERVSPEQEKRDRMFINATSIAVAVVLSVIALFLFLSLPKQPKKAGNDNQ